MAGSADDDAPVLLLKRFNQARGSCEEKGATVRTPKSVERVVVQEARLRIWLVRAKLQVAEPSIEDQDRAARVDIERREVLVRPVDHNDVAWAPALGKECGKLPHRAVWFKEHEPAMDHGEDSEHHPNETCDSEPGSSEERGHK